MLQNKILNYSNIDDYILEFDKLTFNKKFINDDKLSIQISIERVRNGTTTIHLFYIKDKLVGFVALSFEQISKSKEIFNNECLSALCIDFLFVSNNFRKKNFNAFHISSEILDYVVIILFNIDINIGSIKNLILLPADKKLYPFYENYGFTHLNNDWFTFAIR
jgi:hypothetical protein